MTDDAKGREVISESTPKRRRWDIPTPDVKQEDFTPKARHRWDATPVANSEETPRRLKTRWDETPVRSAESIDLSNPMSFFPTSLNPEEALARRHNRELEARNRFLSDVELDMMLPSEGYTKVPIPEGYIGVSPYRQAEVANTSSVQVADDLHSIPRVHLDEDLPDIKPEDFQYFSKLVDKNVDESMDALKERKVLKLILKIKNGSPPMRRHSMRLITEKAAEFGPKLLLDNILPILMSPALDLQERHLMVKVLDRVLFKLGEAVRPFINKILVVTEPLLIDEDYHSRLEAKEIISNLSKAVGLASMIAAMRKDIDDPEEQIRNTTARAFAVVASALGVHTIIPFLRAVCKSKKSWQARHTGLKIIQQIAISTGRGVLPYLHEFTELIKVGLEDEQLKVRVMASLSLSATAEACSPHGLEALEPVVLPVWNALKNHRGKSLAAFLKSAGHLFTIFDENMQQIYIDDLIAVLVKEFSTNDDEMRRIILRVVIQICRSAFVTSSNIKRGLYPNFIPNFWARKVVLDRKNVPLLVDATVSMSTKMTSNDCLLDMIYLLKDDSDLLRAAALEAISVLLGSHMISDDRHVEQLVEGTLFCFQEMPADDSPHNGRRMMQSIASILSRLGRKLKPFILQISSIILWRLSNRSAHVRQFSAELISAIAPCTVICQEEPALAKLGIVLYENLGEEYPFVLASILSSLQSILEVTGVNHSNPPVKDLLPRLTPILRNRHELVQENCVRLIGRIADLAAESVNPREWMRICFELLDLMKAQRKSIRKEVMKTFGFIAKAIGPHDVLSALLNNLKVQERQNRICTTIAIAIVAENCGPFAILPSLMTEYRVPEMNVQNGVLKSMAYMFEYIGEMSKDYVYACTSLLEDALTDRDQVHRQTAAVAIKHIALGVIGFGSEDALIHLLNCMLPNVFDINPHLLMAVVEAVDAMRLAVGPAIVMNYLIQVSMPTFMLHIF